MMSALDLDWEDVRDQLRAWREDNTRHSEEVIDLWVYCLQHYKDKLGDERWMVEEQVFIASLDCYRRDVWEPCLISLNRQFPSSLRVLKLKAMSLEAMEKYDDALIMYDRIIREDETNSTARKRKVAVYRAQGRIADAIKELCTYVNKFMSDNEAWLELCDLYLKEGEFSKASFCMEELIMSNPHNHLYITRYAEIKYTQGGQENLEIARSYFSQSVKLNPNSLRALYGLFLCCTTVASSPKCSAQKKKEMQRLAEVTMKTIEERYSRGDSKTIDCAKIQEAFGVLSITEKA